MIDLNFHGIMPPSPISPLPAEPKPFVSLNQITGKPGIPILIHLAQVILGHGVTPFRSPAIPLERL